MNLQQLNELRDRASKTLALRLANSPSPPPRDPDVLTHAHEVVICAGGACLSCGAAKVATALRNRIDALELDAAVKVVETGCVGCCDLGVVVQTQPDDVLYRKVTEADVELIVTQHLRDNKLIEKLLQRVDGVTYRSAGEMPFFKRQQKIVLENCGLIDPLCIEEYIARDGYQALGKSLVEMTPSAVVAEVERSGLRGRGGGGYGVGLKWGMLASAPGDRKFVICNADEGDPGAFMDRSVLESDPHRVLEGMLLAGYGTGAQRGIIYVRAEYPLALKRLQRAIDQAREYGVLGDRVLESRFRFDIEIRVGAGAFVCGEETALMASVEGERGQPRPRPPYPTQYGLYGCPTMINNVETFANVAPIIRNGGAWFAAIGSPKSPGTKVFALAGAITNTGLVEVPMGTTLREVVFEVGGGVLGGRPFKAAQTGGPSGGCIPAEHLDMPLDFDSLQSIGSIMGSGGLIVMDDTSCMVDVARFFMDFCVDESCGKCPPCRVGTLQMRHMLSKICEGEAGEDELARLGALAEVVSTASLCGLGMTAPNPVLSTMRHFRKEYVAHIQDRTCPSGVCRKLLTFTIDEAKCTGCGLCFRACPVDVIYKVDDQKVYWIDSEACVHCGQCFENCRFGAVLKK